MDIDTLARILHDLQQNLEALAREDPTAIQPSLWLQLYQCHLLLHLERRLGVISWFVTDMAERRNEQKNE